MQAAAGSSAPGLFGGLFDGLFGGGDKPRVLNNGLDGFDPKELLTPEMRQKVEQMERFERDARSAPDFDPNRLGYRRSAFAIGQMYTDSPEEDPDAEVALGTREERLAFLRGFTQNYALDGMEIGGVDDTGGNRCGATSLLAGAMLAGGNDGLKTMIDLVGNDDRASEYMKGELGGLQDKLARGENLSKADLRLLQAGLHDNLRARSVEKFGDRYEEEGAGVAVGAMWDVMQDPALKQLYEDNGLSIGHIDTTGDDKANHYVLQVGSPGSEGAMVYDPQAREDGQVIEGESWLDNYHKARKLNIAP